MPAKVKRINPEGGEIYEGGGDLYKAVIKAIAQQYGVSYDEAVQIAIRLDGGRNEQTDNYYEAATALNEQASPAPWLPHGAAVIQGNAAYKEALFAMEALGHIFSSMVKTPDDLTKLNAPEELIGLLKFSFEVGKNAAKKFGVTQAIELSDADKQQIEAQNKPNFINNPENFTEHQQYTVATLAAIILAPRIAVLKSILKQASPEQRFELSGSISSLMNTTNVPKIYQEAGKALCDGIKTNFPVLLNKAEEFVNEQLKKPVPAGYDAAKELSGIIPDDELRQIATGFNPRMLADTFASTVNTNGISMQFLEAIKGAAKYKIPDALPPEGNSSIADIFFRQTSMQAAPPSGYGGDDAVQQPRKASRILSRLFRQASAQAAPPSGHGDSQNNTIHQRLRELAQDALTRT